MLTAYKCARCTAPLRMPTKLESGVVINAGFDVVTMQRVGK